MFEGSVRGPLLVVVYINDIRYIVPDNSISFVVVDETNIYLADATNLIKKSVQALGKLNGWIDPNKHILHLDKTIFSLL